MRLFTSAITALISLSFLHVASADLLAIEPSLRRRHVGLSSSRVGRGLEKRFDNARFTFYTAGQGACGKVNSNSDFIVALNSAQYAGGAHCFEMITIQYQGKTCQAQIVDECPGCPVGGLDFSAGLFDFFAPESAGVLYGSWTFGSGNPQTPQSTSTPQPQPSPKPSTTWSTSTTSTTYKFSTTSTTSYSSQLASSTTSASTSSSTSYSTSSAAASSSTSTPTAIPTDVISQIYMIMIGMGELAVVAGSS